MNELGPDNVLQRILDCSEHMLIVGGPGSGKTTVALRKSIRRVDSGLGPGQRILFLSFSRAAVARLVEASQAEIGTEKRKFLALQTFHSFFWELLKTFGYLLGSPRKLSILLPHEEKALSGGATPGSEGWNHWQNERKRLFSQEGRVVFDLFAPLCAEMLQHSQLIRDTVAARFPLVIVDEAQDTGSEAWTCIQHLAPLTQVICLADLEQQIFDHLPGVGPQRITEIKNTLRPAYFDLGTDNNRSKGTDIGNFGNDVLSCRTTTSTYRGVSCLRYNPSAVDPTKLMRTAIGMIWRKIEQQTGVKPESCAVLAPSSHTIARITSALSSGDRPIPHKVLFDEAEVILGSRFAAFLLEPKSRTSISSCVAEGLALLADVQRSAGTKTGLKNAATLRRWASQVGATQMPNTKLVCAIRQLMLEASGLRLTGDPAKDWLSVKKILKSSKEPSISEVATQLDYLVAFRRGRRISANLSMMWAQHGAYSQARQALESALAEDQILGGIDDLTGIHVMTIHRSKGKQFDGVIVMREGRRVGTRHFESSLVWRNDQPPYLRSRKILRVAITRAKKHLLILDPFYPACPILGNYRLS